MAEKTIWRGVPAIQLTFHPASGTSITAPTEKHGVVYTKPWVVELILDLAGYTDDRDLAASFAVEPAAGEGAFLVPMIRRLIASTRRYERPIVGLATALLAYELDSAAATLARSTVRQILTELNVPEVDTELLIRN